MLQRLVVPLIVVLGVGCSADPDVLQVADGGLGAHWKLCYWDGPATIRIPLNRQNGKEESDVYTVEAFGIERHGWGSLMPWCWFSASKHFLYLVDKSGPSGKGGARCGSDI